MAKLKDYAEGKWFDNLSEHDQKLLEMNIDFDCYNGLRQMAGESCNRLEDDRTFCDCEWNLFKQWYMERGFTEDEWQYVEACGYERGQFGNEED